MNIGQIPDHQYIDDIDHDDDGHQCDDDLDLDHDDDGHQRKVIKILT